MDSVMASFTMEELAIIEWGLKFIESQLHVAELIKRIQQMRKDPAETDE